MSDDELNERCRAAETLVMQELVLTHPLLFPPGGPTPTCGLCSHKGWIELQRKLFDEIEAIMRANDSLTVEVRESKEKFGKLSLRVLINDRCSHIPAPADKPDDDDTFRIRTLIVDAEKASTRMCIYCGAQYVRKSHCGYIAPKCDAHGGACGESLPADYFGPAI